MYVNTWLFALLVALVSLPAFLTGHLLRQGDARLTTKMALLAIAVLLVASAIMARQTRDRGRH